MLFRFFPLFFLCESTVTVLTNKSQGLTTVAAEDKLSPLQLVATPDYPVAAGQEVHLHCSAFNMPIVTWSWQHLENQTWLEVGIGTDLTLTKPEQSGLYHCSAETKSLQKSVSPNHTVYIVSMPAATAGENLGIAAFTISLLALIINLAILFWLCWQRLGDPLVTTSSTAAKGIPGPENLPKGGLPQADSDRDVYMNYTNTNRAYTDLGSTHKNEDNVYSVLS
ncbi:uncharacterized protein LOC119910542 [Micropterus salmoides]|uniref:uncharacterized protein LOC119910542 n=1 Tax=Micropterus salmoides TaxID=27706 RepID=UPI0018EB05D1|nr:uncharacterized protein LOC119910542 [Micropterus salmoides]